MESVVISVETANEENMAKYAIQSKRGAPPRGAYSQGWRAGDFIFVTGTGPIDPSTGNLVGNTIEQQTEETIDNISPSSRLTALRFSMWSKSLSTSATPVISLATTRYMLSAFRSPIQCAPRLAAIWATPRDANRNRLYRLQHGKDEQEATARFKEAGSTSKKVASGHYSMRSFFRARPVSNQLLQFSPLLLNP